MGCELLPFLKLPSLKFTGTLTWDFRSLFFSRNFPWSVIHRSKPFQIWLRIHEDNQLSCLHSGVNDTVVIREDIQTKKVGCTAVSMKPLCNQLFSNIFANNSTHCFLDGNLTQLHTAQWCHWHCCDMHSGVDDAAVQIWHRCDFGPHIREALATLKEISIEKTFSCTIPITFTQKIWGVTRDPF
jgi:hypothetical protein